jgi:hypothetical protein
MSTVRPLPGVMYGLTHEEDGTLRIREPKLLKIGIGMPKGRAITVWTSLQDGKLLWRMTMGFKKPDIKTASFASRQECEDAWHQAAPSVPICPYPRKISFFTFTKPVTTENGEEFVPDFDAIEAHGAVPTEIDVVFLDDNPFFGQYQMWSASELRCRGDGINAMRIASMAPKGAEIPKGEKYFPILEGCWIRGCEYAGKECKPGGDLKLQLAKNIRVGGTAYFHTTGFRSISQIFSSLERIKMLTNGRLKGLPLKMLLRPYRVRPEGGKAGTQYGVSLELRSEDMEALRKLLVANLWQAPAIAAPRKMIEAPEDEVPISAGAMTAEFYPDASEPDEDGADAPVIATATNAKTQELGKRLAKAREAAPVQALPTQTVNGEVQQGSTEPAIDGTAASARNDVKSATSPPAGSSTVSKDLF